MNGTATRRWAPLVAVVLAPQICAVVARAEVVAPLPPAPPEEAAEQVNDQDDRLADLEEQLRGVALGRAPTVSLSGYGDFGFFVPQGDGTGFVQDLGPAAERHFPQYADRYGWVFLGDILAPAVNTRGEPADLGNPPGVNRQDLIDSNGAPGFIANELNLTLNAGLASNVLGVASVDFLPRTGTDFRFGDAFAVDLLFLEWMLGRDRRTSIFVGKVESVLGIEYPERKAIRRFGITPSLIARYTTGTPLGLKLRSKLGRGDWLIVAAALSNGSSVIEPFHFYDETDSNAGKTASGRLAVALPLPVRVELGGSGLYGSQDRATDSQHPLWFVGADLQLTLGGWQLKAEWLRGEGTGEVGPAVDPARRVYGLRLRSGGYAQVNGMLGPYVGVLVRGEMRDALVWLGDPDLPGGAERLYVTKSWRVTAGLRVVLTERIVVKAEYLRNGEYGGVPAIANDVFTSSVVMAY